MKRLLLQFVCILLLGGTAYCTDIQLGTINYQGAAGSNITYAGSPTVLLAWGTPRGNEPRVMNNEMDFGVFTSADIGRTVSISWETPGFNFFNSLLTNGADDRFEIWSFLKWSFPPQTTKCWKRGRYG